jgi:phosphate transport system substrate-binding protein
MSSFKNVVQYFSKAMIIVYLLVAFLLFFRADIFEMKQNQRFILASIILVYTAFKIYRIRVQNNDKTSLFIPFLLFFCSCNHVNLPTHSDTPTTGEIKIAAEESYAPIIDAQLYAFHSFYKYAKINVHYASEGEIIKELLKDSVRLVVMSRTLNESEKKTFEKQKIIPRITKIAYDAVAIIAHPNNKDSMLTLAQLKNRITGIDKSYAIVFDHNQSGNARFLKEKFLGDQAFPSNCFALHSNQEVLDYVSKNEKALGVIAVSWVSDKDDPKMLSFLKNVKVISLAKADQPLSIDEYYKPYQAYIQQGLYPLCREVFVVSREARAGLGSGFAAFLAGDKGQRMILKSGLVPANAPIRLIELN